MAFSDYIRMNLDQPLFHQPNSLVIVVGDFNSTSTGLRLNNFTWPNNVKQLVNFKTRDSATLDWFLTSKPKLFQISQLPKLDTTDHYMILAQPTLSTSTPSQSRKVKVRDLRDSAWRTFVRWLTMKDWLQVRQ